jgi:hypothetical protein
MNEALVSFLSAAATTVLCSICILFLPSPHASKRLERAFLAFTVSASLLCLFYTALTLHNPALFSTTLHHLLFYRLWVPVGVGVASTVFRITKYFRTEALQAGGALDSFTKSGFVLDGLCFSTSLSFLTIELGKIAHDQEMRTFFTQSGFPIWFMYAVMSVEILASLGLFFRATVVGSASFLFLIMCGAIFTHCQNRDPLSDSIDALHILILLVCIVLLHLIDSPPPFDPFRSRT